MASNIQVTCIIKRGGNSNPHERIESLGGNHHGRRWLMSENAVIAELEKPAWARSWNFYVRVAGRTAWIVVAMHNGRKYLKTEADGYEPNNLLSLSACPV